MRTAYIIEPEDMARLRAYQISLSIGHSQSQKPFGEGLAVILSRAIEIELPDAAPDGPSQCHTVRTIKTEGGSIEIG
jgi:hypothetical protein